MKLLSLNLHNFMAYKGTHEINFDVTPQAPVILFLGENGHGKSTIQHAVRWCLYGQTFDRDREIKVPLLLNRKTTSSEGYGTAEVRVNLTWTDSGQTYELERSWKSSDAPSEVTNASLRVDGSFIHAAAIPETVQRFLAKEISHFFLFNGEVQKEFDDMVSNTKSATFIRDEIEKTLSIPVITECVSWLGSKRAEENALIVRTNAKNVEVANKGKLLEEVHQRLTVLEEERLKQQKNFDDANHQVHEFDERVGDIKAAQAVHEKIVEHRATRKYLTEQRQDEGEKLVIALSRYPWLSLAPQILELRTKISTDLEVGDKAAARVRQIQHTIDSLKEIQTSHVCPVCHSTQSDFSPDQMRRLDELEIERTNIDVPDVEDLRRRAALITSIRFDENVFVETRNTVKRFNGFGAEIASNNQKLLARERELELLGNPEIANLLADQRAWIGARETASKSLESYNLRIAEEKRTEARLENDIAKGQGVSPRNKVAFTAYSYLADLFSYGKERYTSAVKETVQQNASETFLDIISDKKYEGLKINQNYGVDLVMQDGEIDPVPSTGQGKVSTISLVSGLIKTVMPEGFVLMDTPFVSLDSGHREQVCKWAAESGLYVSLFMHSGEFDRQQLMNFFEGRVGRVFQIKQIDTNESTINEEL